MTASFLAFALLGLAPPQVDVTVNAKDGDVVAGERSFRVSVVANNPVTQVEFYVGDELRDSDTSTPYVFKLDSLVEKDGPLKVTFAAYTTEGESAKKSLTLRIDNGVDKGADFHVTRGNELLQVSKWDDAVTAGRVALKAKPGYVPAMIVLARANLGKGVLDKAQQFAEDAAAAETTNVEALELLSAINLKKAFNTLNRGGDKAETASLIRGALKAAVEARQKTLEHHLSQQSPEKNVIAYADAALRAGRYTLAINALEPEFKKDQRRSDVANRLAFAQLRTARYQEAYQTLKDLQKFGTLDAYGYALLAIVESETGNDNRSDEALREAILSDPEDVGVLTTQAYLALKKNRTSALAKLATSLAASQGQRTEVNAYLTALYNKLGQYAESDRYFERAVLAEPANYDMYIERGNEIINVALNGRLEAKDAEFQLSLARIMFETALIAKPDSAEALTGMTIISLLERKPADAAKYGAAAVAASPKYAAAHYANSAALSANRQVAEAQRASDMAGRLDKQNLEGRQLPEATAAWRYFWSGGRTPMLTPPK